MKKVPPHMLPVISMIRSSKETEAVVIMPGRIPLDERKWAFTSVVLACFFMTILIIEVVGWLAGGSDFARVFQGVACVPALIVLGAYWFNLPAFHNGRALYADRIEVVGTDMTPVVRQLQATDIVRFVDNGTRRTVSIFDRSGQRTALIEDPVCYDMQGRPTGTDLVEELRQRIRVL